MIKELSTLTGISEELINQKGISFIMRYPKALGLTKAKERKLLALIEFHNKYNQAEFLNEKPLLNSSSVACDFIKKIYKDITDKEYLYVVMLNTQNEVIEAKQMFEGTLNESAVYPRELIKEVLNHNANLVIISHNHPCGSTKPSTADISFTKKIKEALDTVQVKLIDHIICTPYGETTSFAEKGLL